MEAAAPRPVADVERAVAATRVVRMLARPRIPLEQELRVIAGLKLLVAAMLFAQQGPPPQGQPAGGGKRGQRKPAPQQPMPADVEPIVTTASGLKYCVLHVGAPGESPRWGDKVKVHYSGWHQTGEMFESTREQGPIEFDVGMVVDGLNEALELMTKGARWKIVVEPELGYGKLGNPPRIAPNERLTFDLELLDFTRGPKLPDFHAADPSKQKKTESGVIYEPIVEGTGPAPKPTDVVELKFATWNTKGRLIDCGEKHDDFRFIGRVEDFSTRLLQIAPQFMKVGGRYRFEAPPEFCKGLPFGAPFLPEGSTTVWEIELVSAKEITLPPFTKPDPANQKSTATGLKYEVLKEGEGAPAKLGDKIEVVYIGWTVDGVAFDTSYYKGVPYALTLKSTGIIRGWIEGLQLMKPGAKYRFEIPPALAYGPNPFGKIPANSTLIFDIELVKCTPPTPPPAKDGAGK